MPVKLSGLEEMKVRLKQVATNTHAQVKTAVEAEAARLLAESQARVPVKSGALRASGRVTMVDSGTTVTAVISFGNEDVPYATYIHEDLALKHPNGQAKFLESVMDEESVHVGGALAGAIDLDKA